MVLVRYCSANAVSQHLLFVSVTFVMTNTILTLESGSQSGIRSSFHHIARLSFAKATLAALSGLQAAHLLLRRDVREWSLDVPFNYNFKILIVSTRIVE